MSQFPDVTTDLVVLVIILTVLYMVRSHHLRISMALVLFPVQEVHFLQELLLMMLQLSNHRSRLFAPVYTDPTAYKDLSVLMRKKY